MDAEKSASPTLGPIALAFEEKTPPLLGLNPLQLDKDRH